MKTVAEVSRISGVSVRTLHHYDAIGLLKPTAVTEAGYRLYGDDALRRLQSILLLRELQFPLADIRTMLDNPQFDRLRALEDQIALLELERERIDALLVLARQWQSKGDIPMDFSPFDRTESDRCKAEAKQRWGNTAAWQAYETRAAQPDYNETSSADALMQKFAAFGTLLGGAPTDDAAQTAVADLQAFITAQFYPCTNEILAGLGEMYVADERFRQNIDAAGGNGTAQFVRDAIRAFCKQ